VPGIKSWSNEASQTVVKGPTYYSTQLLSLLATGRAVLATLPTACLRTRASTSTPATTTLRTTATPICAIPLRTSGARSRPRTGTRLPTTTPLTRRPLGTDPVHGAAAVCRGCGPSRRAATITAARRRSGPSRRAAIARPLRLCDGPSRACSRSSPQLRPRVAPSPALSAGASRGDVACLAVAALATPCVCVGLIVAGRAQYAHQLSSTLQRVDYAHRNYSHVTLTGLCGRTV
jgi:hypothetical protein